jgi:hypothetical protein
MRFEAGFGGAAVRYASVGAGFRDPCGPRTGTDRPTDGAEKATDGAGGSGYADRPARILVLTWYLSLLSHRRRCPHRKRYLPRVAEASLIRLFAAPACPAWRNQSPAGLTASGILREQGTGAGVRYR